MMDLTAQGEKRWHRVLVSVEPQWDGADGLHILADPLPLAAIPARGCPFQDPVPIDQLN